MAGTVFTLTLTVKLDRDSKMMNIMESEIPMKIRTFASLARCLAAALGNQNGLHKSERGRVAWNLVASADL